MIFRMMMSCVALAMAFSMTAAALEPGLTGLTLRADSLRPVWSDSSLYIILPGQRTKITAPGVVSHSLMGKIYALRPDTIVLVTDRFYPEEPNAWNISLKNIRKYQIPKGYKAHTLTGAIIGGSLGAALSTAFALADNHRSPSNRPFPYLATVTGGGIIGALVGAITRAERWETVPVDKLKLGLPLPGEPIPVHTIAVSERVRILAPDFGKYEITGWIYALGKDYVALVDIPVFDRKVNYQQIPLDRIKRYQISLGRQTHGLMGALAGLCTGIFIGAVMGDTGMKDPDQGGSNDSVLPFAAAGLVAGGLVGFNIKTDEWKTIPIERLRLE